MEFESAHSNTTAKLPILKLGEYEMWVIRIKQYFQVQDYALWEVIENGNSWVFVPQTTQENGTSVTKMSVPVTAKEKTNKKNDVKARSLLLMALPNEHQTLLSSATTMLKTNVFCYKKTIWKMNKAKIETMSINDLYNNFKIVEQSVKKSIGASSGAQNLAFMTALSTSSTNDTPKHAYERNKAGQFRNQDNTRKHGNNEDTSFKAMLGYKMYYELNQTEFTAATYKIGLTTVEEQLITYRKNEVLFSKEVAVLKREVACKDYEINMLKSEFEKVKQEKKCKPLMDHKGFVNSRCSRHMTGNIAYLSDCKEFDGGYVTFGGGAHGGRISGNLSTAAYSKPRTPQQNGVAERRNRTLIEAARTILGKFDGKSDEDFFVGYSLSNKAFRVYNTRTRGVEENLHIGFLENKPMIEGNGLKWVFDIDSLIQSMNYVPVAVDASYFDSPSKDVDNGEPKYVVDDQKHVEDGLDNENDANDNPEVKQFEFKLNTVDPSIEPTSIAKALSDSSWVEAMQEELLQFKLHNRIYDTLWIFIFVHSYMGTIEEEVMLLNHYIKDLWTIQTKVYKVVKALYGLHQAPEDGIETLANLTIAGATQDMMVNQLSLTKGFDAGRYALTETSTIYVSLINQFWCTASVKTLDNGEIELIATVDGQEKSITKASVRRHLKLADADGISSLPTTKICEQLALMGICDRF
ncbi:ribonuclease H-like domain-containing protein [Tanacetum coccineum]